jgi:hypothetical protein
MPTTATEAAVQFGFTPVGTAGADDSFQITGAQFEQAALNNAGSAVGVPTAYEQRPSRARAHQGAALLLADRGSEQLLRGGCSLHATNTITAAFATPVQMRATPTAAFTVGGFQGVINGAGAAGLTGSGVATSNANSVVSRPRTRAPRASP